MLRALKPHSSPAPFAPFPAPPAVAPPTLQPSGHQKTAGLGPTPLSASFCATESVPSVSTSWQAWLHLRVFARSSGLVTSHGLVVSTETDFLATVSPTLSRGFGGQGPGRTQRFLRKKCKRGKITRYAPQSYLCRLYKIKRLPCSNINLWNISQAKVSHLSRLSQSSYLILRG